MAIILGKKQKISDLPGIVISAPQQQNVSIAQPPSSNLRITGVDGPRPRVGAPQQVNNPMDNPLGWLGDTAKGFVTGVADTLNPFVAFPALSRGIAETLAYNSKDSRNARESQMNLQNQNISLLKHATQKIQDPNTDPAERVRWQSFVRSQGHLAGTNQFQDATTRNDEIIQATDPVAGALNTVAVGTQAFGGKQVADAGTQVAAALSRNGVKQGARNFLTREATVGRTDIPITKTGGGDAPVPVRVSQKIPVRAEAPNDVLDARLSTEVDVLSKRYEKAIKAAGNNQQAITKVEATYGPKFDELLAKRDAGVLPQRITVQNAPVVKPVEVVAGPKVSLKQPNPTVTPKTIAQPVDEIPAIASGKSPGIMTRSWKSVAGVLDKSGTGGKLINQGVQRARDFSEKATGSLITDLEQAGFNSIDEAGFKKVWDAVEKGSAEGLSNEERRLAAALVRTMNRVHTTATDYAGMNIGDRGPTYLPHWYKEGDKDMVAFFKREFNQRNSNLERQRQTDMAGYEKSKESIARYIQNATERIGRAKEFGQGDEKLKQMFDVAGREGYNVDQLARYAKTALGDVDYNSTAHKVSGAIRKVEAVTSLQKSAAANIGQQVNTVTVAGVKNWAKAAYKYWSDPNARDWAKRTGVFGDHVLGNLQKQYAANVGDNLSGNQATRIFKKHFLVPGMQAVEKFNRANAVLAGKGFAEDLIKKAARGDKKAQRLMQTYFPTLEPGKPITNDMVVDAARELVKRTQFKVDPVDLPNWANGPLGKLIAQFRSFGYKQTQFMAREVIGEALHGNFAPMTRFLAIGVPTGYAINEARNAVSGTFFDQKKQEEFAKKPWYQRAFEGFSQIGGGGMPLSEGQNIMRNAQYADKDNKLRDVATGTLGPFITDVARGLDAGSKALQGEYKDGAVFLAQQTPIVGPVVANFVKKAMAGNTDNPTTMTPDELDKYKKTTYAKFIENMSKQDKDLMAATSDSDYAWLGVNSGKFTQDQVDEMQTKYNRELFKAGLPIKYINSITNDEYKSLSPELQGMVMEASLVGQKKFKESTTYDKTAEAVMAKAMEQAWPEIGDIKGSNKLALDYLEAQRDYAESGKTDDQGKQFDIVKGFWTKAVKEQYTEKIRNIYSNSISDIKTLTEGVTVNGVKYQVGKQDLDAAVSLDNRLLMAGLINTPKFSNETRRAYGYGDAPTSKVDGLGYAGPKVSSGSGKRGAGSAYEHAVSISAGGKAPRPKVTVASVGKTKTATSRRASKPKVSSRKSLV